MSASALRLRLYTKDIWQFCMRDCAVQKRMNRSDMECGVCPFRWIPKPKLRVRLDMSSPALLLRLYRKARRHNGMRRVEKTKNKLQLDHGERGAAFWFNIKARKPNLGAFLKCCGALLLFSKSSSIACHDCRGGIKSSILAVGVVSFIPQLPVIFTKTIFTLLSWGRLPFQKQETPRSCRDLLSRRSPGFMDFKSKR